MNISFFILALFFLNTASATIWITIGDAKTQKIGAIGASSGPIGDDKTIPWQLQYDGGQVRLTLRNINCVSIYT